MATPNVGILTTAGKALIDKVNSGQAKISFSKIVFSSMDNSQLSDMQVKALTAIAPQEVVVSSPETTLDTNSGETRIRATGTNEKLADGVYVKTYGVFAKDDTGSEILYGVTVSPNPNYFPAYDGVTPQAVTYSYKTVIQETSNITMTNSNDVYASQEDLTEAIQPYAKTVDVNQQLDKKVNVSDMRKPASDVAGIEEVNAKQDKIGYTPADDSKVVHDNHDGTEQLNGVQVQPFNKLSDTIGGRNLLPISNYGSGFVNGVYGSVVLADNAGKEVISDFVPVDITQSYYCQIIQQVNNNLPWYGIGFYDNNEKFISRFANGSTNLTGTITSVIRMLPFGFSNISIPNVSTVVFPANTAYVRISFSTYGKPIQASLEKSSVLSDWTPAPEDKVNVTDMRTPASNVAGIEEVNAKQDKIGYTPADDSKVAHLSGANNFNTVPTVNNNPLLLASSLPSDLARTGQDQEFTGKNTFDVAPIDKTTGNPYITKDGVPAVPSTLADTTKLSNFTAGLQKGGKDVATQTDVTNAISTATANMVDSSKPTNFTAGLQSGGVDVATAADLNNYYHANASDDAALAAAKSATVPGIFWFEEV